MSELFYREKSIDGIKKLKRVSSSTLLILEEAEKLGISWKKVPYTDLFQLNWQDQIKFFRAQIPSETTALALYCCDNKRIAKNILAEAGLSVSQGFLIQKKDTDKYKSRIFKNLRKPLVVKPIDGCQGANVHLDINNEEAYFQAIQSVYNYFGRQQMDLLVEEMFEGEEFRILATQEKILSVIKRIPANVLGDGQHSIKELIEEKNKDPLREKVATYHLIEIDENLENFLEEQKLNLESIPAKGKQIFVREHSPLDISLGGDTVDFTDKIHPTVKTIVSRIMKSIPGLALTGVDYMSVDISAEQGDQDYRIIEINSSPSLDWNQFPIIGKKRNVSKEFLRLMFPKI